MGKAAYEVKNVPGRSSILIHSGNTAGDVDKGQKSNVQGCILLGFSRNTQSGQATIQESRAAVAAFMDKMGGRPFTLTIISAEGDVGTPDAASQSGAGGGSALSPMAQAVGASMPTPSTPAPTTVAPVSNSVADPGVGQGEPSLGGSTVAEASVIKKAQAERQANATALQAQESDAALSQNFSGVAEVMKKQLETQLKMAKSLDNIDQGIQTLVKGGGQSQAPSTADSSENQGMKPSSAARPTDIPVRTTPISMKRIAASR